MPDTYTITFTITTTADQSTILEQAIEAAQGFADMVESQHDHEATTDTDTVAVQWVETPHREGCATHIDHALRCTCHRC